MRIAFYFIRITLTPSDRALSDFLLMSLIMPLIHAPLGFFVVSALSATWQAFAKAGLAITKLFERFCLPTLCTSTVSSCRIERGFLPKAVVALTRFTITRITAIFPPFFMAWLGAKTLTTKQAFFNDVSSRTLQPATSNGICPVSVNSKCLPASLTRLRDCAFRAGHRAMRLILMAWMYLKRVAALDTVFRYQFGRRGLPSSHARPLAKADLVKPIFSRLEQSATLFTWFSSGWYASDSQGMNLLHRFGFGKARSVVQPIARAVCILPRLPTV